MALDVYRSLTDAIAGVYKVIALDPTRGASAPVAELSRAVQVYDHTPKPGDPTGPVIVTVNPYGVEPEFFMVSVDIYSSVQNDARDAVVALDTTIKEVDALLPSTVGPSRWNIAVDLELGCYIAEAQLQALRSDYY